RLRPRAHHARLWAGRQSSYRRVLRFLALRFFGTLAPAARASDRPIATACLRLLTLRPDRPLRSVPALRFFLARPTLVEAFFEYRRAMWFSRLHGSNPRELRWFRFAAAVSPQHADDSRCRSRSARIADVPDRSRSSDGVAAHRPADIARRS